METTQAKTSTNVPTKTRTRVNIALAIGIVALAVAGVIGIQSQGSVERFFSSLFRPGGYIQGYLPSGWIPPGYNMPGYIPGQPLNPTR